MPEEDDVRRLDRGPKAWNEWRSRNKEKVPVFSSARLDGKDLSGLNLERALILRCNLTGADLTSSDLSNAEIERSQFIRTNLSGADFYSAVVTESLFEGVKVDIEASFVGVRFIMPRFANVDLTNANLQGASFFQSEFVGVSFRSADLTYAVFHGAKFVGCDFTRAIVGDTVFADVDFGDSVGLNEIAHLEPSTVGIDTFFASRGLPDAFLRGAGVPDDFIAYSSSLVGKPIEYYSCFISYSSHDEEIARRLYADLQARNIRVWFAPEHLKIGDRFRSRIDQSIRIHDKLIVILSAAALTSAWVETEVETAFARERREHRDVLFPIRVDDEVFSTDAAWASTLVETRHVGDFRNWKRHDDYVAAFERLLRDLKRSGPLLMSTDGAS